MIIHHMCTYFSMLLYDPLTFVKFLQHLSLANDLISELCSRDFVQIPSITQDFFGAWNLHCMQLYFDDSVRNIDDGKAAGLHTVLVSINIPLQHILSRCQQVVGGTYILCLESCLSWFLHPPSQAQGLAPEAYKSNSTGAQYATQIVLPTLTPTSNSCLSLCACSTSHKFFETIKGSGILIFSGWQFSEV
jgi:hypothetical protein